AAESSIVTAGVNVLRRLVGRAPAAVVGGGVLLGALAVVGITRLRVNNSYLDWFYPNTRARVENDFINESFGGTTTIHLLIQATVPQGLEDPRVLAAVAGVEDELRAMPEVGKVVSYVDFLGDLHRAYTGAAPGALPATRPAVAQYLLLYSMDLGPDGLGWLID